MILVMILFKFAKKTKNPKTFRGRGIPPPHPGSDVYEIAIIKFIDAFNINERAVANIKKLS